MKKALALLVIIFTADMLMPFGVAIGLLYTISIFLVIRESRTTIISITVAASIFVILKFLWYYSNNTEYYFIANRVITVFTLWITAAIAIKFRILKEHEQLASELERKNRESEQFIYIASHDLNEPLRTVKSMTMLLEGKLQGKSDDETRQFLYFINTSIDRMGTLIHSLLDYGRLGKDSEKAIVDCTTLLSEVSQDLHLLLKENDALITFGKMPEVKVFPDEFRLLFQNLIANAIKFRKRDVAPKIKIKCRHSRNELLFSVADNGIGIAEANLEKIFTIFKKLHSHHDYEGAGIGLAHCRKIVEMHNGRIWAESEPGKGSVFYFTIPTK